ncbi:MAG: hypothetical protein Q9174_003353, partial [Haloplaca sp. 1 TL-2023]
YIPLDPSLYPVGVPCRGVPSLGNSGMFGSIGERGGSPCREGDRCEFAVDGGRGTPAASLRIPPLPDPDEKESSSSMSLPL